MTLRVFIGSSTESEPVAQAVGRHLGPGIEPLCWSRGVFQLTRTAFDNLLRIVREVDAAVFVCTPDDLTTSRGRRRPAVRDNVIFEIGLFLGRLGQQRTFLVAPEPLSALRLPTDLLGVVLARYDPAELVRDAEAALAAAASQIRRALEAAYPPVPDDGAAGAGFRRVIDRHRGVRSPHPVALAISVLSPAASIRPAVEGFLDGRGWQMPVESIQRTGLSTPDDVARFVAELQAKRRRFERRGVTEVHLFYAGPVSAAALVGMALDNWVPVKLYQKPRSVEAGIYEYFAPLVKG